MGLDYDVSHRVNWEISGFRIFLVFPFGINKFPTEDSSNLLPGESETGCQCREMAGVSESSLCSYSLQIAI